MQAFALDAAAEEMIKVSILTVSEEWISGGCSGGLVYRYKQQMRHQRSCLSEDWLAVTTVMFHIGGFGPLAVAVIPQIDLWLESPNEYVQFLATTTIVKFDPSRTEFLSKIRDATISDQLGIRSFALEFFGEAGEKEE